MKAVQAMQVKSNSQPPPPMKENFETEQKGVTGIK